MPCVQLISYYSRDAWTHASQHATIKSLKAWAEAMNQRYDCLKNTLPK